MGSVIQISVRTDPHKDMPPGSGSAWTDPDSGGKKPRKLTGSLVEYRTGNISKDPFVILYVYQFLMLF